jgi:hypothetical protein
MTISARWQPADATTGDALTLRAVAAMAAGLALPAMATESAGALAEVEGLVTHLTSLVLIDEAATQEASIPATRKVALPTPRTAARRMMAAAPMAAGAFPAAPPPVAAEGRASAKMAAPRPSGIASRLRSLLGRDGTEDEAPVAPSRPERDRFAGGGLADAIDWDQAPHRLQAGDLASLDPAIARAIRDLATRADVIDLANRLALDPLVLVIGLLARTQADRNRSAARIARAIFGKRPSREVDEAAATAGIG